jgi:streptogramin lyase
MRVVSSLPCFLLACAISISLTGCSLNSTAGPAPESGLAMRGAVYGGQSPITGAHVYLLAANTAANAGPGLAATSSNKSNSLLTVGSVDSVGTYVTTDSSGNFTISSDYTCTGGQQVYLYALGGNPGLTAGTNNTSAGLMAALGTCPGTTGSTGNTFSSGLFVQVNEVSTVAAAYSFAGYATDATHVSSSGTAQAKVGIANAFENAANLETLSTGVALATTPTASGSSTVPQSEINTLADILAACVNTTGSVSGPSSPTPCYTLFTNALSGGTTGTQPTDTATAAINIAHNPSANITALYGLAATNPPFVGLSTQPNDFVVVLSFIGGGIAGNSPNGIAIDGSGNVWTANPGPLVTSVGTVTELASSGQSLSGFGYTGGINRPFGLAIDNSTPANVWVTNYNGNSVTELNSSGTASGGSPYTAGSMNQPAGIAIDGTGDLWISNNGNSSVTELTSAGAAHSGTPSTGGGLSVPFGIAVDFSGNAWVANTTGSSVSEFTSSGGVHTGAPYGGGGVSNSVGVAFDSSGNAWISNKGGSVTELNSSGTPSAGSPYSGGGLSSVNTAGSGLIAIDGAGNVWVANIDGGGSANSHKGSITELSNSGTAISGPNGYTGADTSSVDLVVNPIGLAIDPSGNVWASCSGNVVELVGAATPVVTPLSTAVATSKYGTRP